MVLEFDACTWGHGTVLYRSALSKGLHRRSSGTPDKFSDKYGERSMRLENLKKESGSNQSKLLRKEAQSKLGDKACGTGNIVGHQRSVDAKEALRRELD